MRWTICIMRLWGFEMTTAELTTYFMRRRRIGWKAAHALAESVVIRRTLKPDRPRGADREQMRIAFVELRRP